MSKKMICPFCGQELEQEQGSDEWFYCVNAKCCYNHTTSYKTVWQALIQSKEEIECLKHNYSVVKEQHERGYAYATKTINRLESDLQIAKQALKKYASKGDWGDAMDENGSWINDSLFYANGYTVAETALEQITHDSKD